MPHLLSFDFDRLAQLPRVAEFETLCRRVTRDSFSRGPLFGIG
jgi:hypothetical protein